MAPNYPFQVSNISSLHKFLFLSQNLFFLLEPSVKSLGASSTLSILSKSQSTHQQMLATQPLGLTQHQPPVTTSPASTLDKPLSLLAQSVVGIAPCPLLLPLFPFQSIPYTEAKDIVLKYVRPSHHPDPRQPRLSLLSMVKVKVKIKVLPKVSLAPCVPGHPYFFEHLSASHSSHSSSPATSLSGRHHTHSILKACHHFFLCPKHSDPTSSSCQLCTSQRPSLPSNEKQPPPSDSPYPLLLLCCLQCA